MITYQDDCDGESHLVASIVLLLLGMAIGGIAVWLFFTLSRAI